MALDDLWETIEKVRNLAARGLERGAKGAGRAFGGAAKVLGGEELAGQRHEAFSHFERAREELEAANEHFLRQLFSSRKRLKQQLPEEKEFEKVEKVQRPLIVAAEAEVQKRRLAEKAAIRALRAAPPSGVAKARARLAKASRRLKRARARKRHLEKPVEDARRAADEARTERKREVKYDVESSRKRLERARSHHALAQERKDEFSNPKPHLQRGFDTIYNRLPNILHAAQQGLAAGPAGAALAGGAQMGLTVAEGAAMAFGGPFGPAMAKGIRMLEQFAGFGFKAAGAMDELVKSSQAEMTGLGKSSPSMAIANRMKEFADFLNDMKRGEYVAPLQNIVNREDLQYTNLNRINQLEVDTENQRLALMQKLAKQRLAAYVNSRRGDPNRIGWVEQFFGSGGGGLLTEGLKIFGTEDATSSVLTREGSVQSIATWLTAMRMRMAPTAEEKRQMEELEREARKQKEKAEENERLNPGGANPFGPGGYFETVRGRNGEISLGEEMAAMGHAWSESFGRPIRHDF